MRVVPWDPKRERVTFLEYVPGVTLGHVLECAKLEHATRVLLVGPPPGRDWFIGELPEVWAHGMHHLDQDTPTGRYVFDPTVTAVQVEVRRAAEWFGDRPLTVAQAREAFYALEELVERQGSRLFRSPGATGMNLWLAARRGDVPDPLDDDTAQLIRSTSPQHRIEIMPAPPWGATMPGLWVVDGRWMYAALTNELGCGPVTWLRGNDAAAALARNRYARGRFLVRWQAPPEWEGYGWPGMLMAQRPDGGWHAPLTGEAWADSAEIAAAMTMDWDVTVLEGFMFTPGRPLDAWTARLVRMRDAASASRHHGPEVNGAVAGAVRAILLHTIGAFHSSGTAETTVTASPMVRPDGDGWDAPEEVTAGRWLWRRRRDGGSARQNALRHPEFSSQVWGRAHARILSGPTSAGPSVPSGALHVPAGTLVGIYGDAIMTTVRPAWADADDGTPGRLRVKGHLCGPLPWPTTALERDALTRMAQAAGTDCTRGCQR